MTISEYAQKEEQCKNDTLGKNIGNGQCWDLVQDYVVNYLGVPEYVLAGCGYVNNLLVEPKINDVLEYFDEVPMTQMLKGDMVIWYAGHIAIFDSFDGVNCIYLTQNKGTGEAPIGGVYLSSLYLGDARAFRIKGIIEDKKEEPIEEFKVGDYVVPTILEDYQGTQLVQYDDLYQIIEKDERGNVLGAVRGEERPIWAVLPDSNIRKA